MNAKINARIAVLLPRFTAYQDDAARFRDSGQEGLAARNLAQLVACASELSFLLGLQGMTDQSAKMNTMYCDTLHIITERYGGY